MIEGHREQRLQIQRSILAKAAEPQKGGELVNRVQEEVGCSNGTVRGELWYMIDRSDVILRQDRRIQNGVEHTRQLNFPGWDQDNDRLTEIYNAKRSDNANR